MQRLVILTFFCCTMATFDRASLNEIFVQPFSCNQSIYFNAPTKSTFSTGDDIHVKIGVSNHNFVSYVDLYLGKALVRRDYTYPFEWGAPGGTDDALLRNMNAGNYQITAVVKDICGKKKPRSRYFKVANRYAAFNQYFEDLTVIRKVRSKHSNSKISEYRKGSESFLKVQRCGRTSIYNYWYDIQGKQIGRFRSNSRRQGRFTGARFQKVWSNSCRRG